MSKKHLRTSLVFGNFEFGRSLQGNVSSRYIFCLELVPVVPNFGVDVVQDAEGDGDNAGEDEAWPLEELLLLS